LRDGISSRERLWRETWMGASRLILTRWGENSWLLNHLILVCACFTAPSGGCGSAAAAAATTSALPREPRNFPAASPSQPPRQHRSNARNLSS
jgi:hypothetical protein